MRDTQSQTKKGKGVGHVCSSCGQTVECDLNTDLYEVGIEVEKDLWLQIATMPDCKVKDELVKHRNQLKQALAKAES